MPAAVSPQLPGRALLRRIGVALPLAALRLAALTIAACTSRPDAPPVTPDSGASAAQRPAVVPVMPLQLDSMPVRPGASVARVAVRRDTTSFSVGRAVVTLASGDTIVVSDSAFRAWKLGGSLVAVSGLDGAGGFENEGQSLTVIDVASGARRRVLADYFPIVRVELLQVGTHRGVLVHMRDGGQGSLHVTVVDPARGQVFRALHALGRIAGGSILVSGYGDSDQPVDFGDRRQPLRVDTIAAAAIDTMSLLVVPRSPQ
jgi:hypothetical protein